MLLIDVYIVGIMLTDHLVRYKYIPRPNLGMTFEAIKLLEPAHVDKIRRMYNIDDGLIVQEVCNAFLMVLKFS